MEPCQTSPCSALFAPLLLPATTALELLAGALPEPELVGVAALRGVLGEVAGTPLL